MRRKIPKTVGSIIVYDDDNDSWSMRWAVEQDYGRNCRGETGLFYLNRDISTDSLDNRVYYMTTVPGGYIEASDPDFYKYAYTYNQLSDLCRNDEEILHCVLDLLNGQDPREVYKKVKNRFKRR